MKKLFIVVMAMVAMVLTGCSSKPPMHQLSEQEYQELRASSRNQVVVVNPAPAAPVAPQVVYMQGRPMYAPYNAFIPVPGQPPRVTQPQGYYYQ